MVGFGAAMTDASAILIEQALPRAKRHALLQDLFGPDGLAIDFVRVPIGASDFSPEHYSLDDMPGGQSDPRLEHFTMAGPDRAQVPALQAARKINPRLAIVASPWSAPGWMKTTDSLMKGHLKPEYYDAFARYLGRYVDEMAARGLPVEWLTIQNEPDFEPEDYPGMKVTASERAAIIGGYLGPLLAQRSRPVKILDWDHNWDKPENPLAVLRDKTANRYVSGVAWHCYAGEVAAMEQVRAAYPDKDVFFTECSGGEWAPDWGSTLAWMTDNLVIAPSRSGSRGTLLWNLALDRAYGPHKGGCGDCRGVVTIDRATGEVTRNLEYYVLGHVSRFVRQGAARIGSNAPGGLPNVAFRNPDGSLVLLAHNSAAKPKQIRVHFPTGSFEAELPAGEIATFTWRE